MKKKIQAAPTGVVQRVKSKMGWCLDGLHDQCWRVSIGNMMCGCDCHDGQEQTSTNPKVREFLERSFQDAPVVNKEMTVKQAISAEKGGFLNLGKKQCLCGCGEPVKSNYRPGHDQRHLSGLARQVQSGKTTPEQAAAELPTDALRAKLAKRLAP